MRPLASSPLAIRVLDMTLAGSGLVLLLPLLALVAVAVKLTSSGPVFFRSTRVGQGGRLFSLWKFRSMVSGADRLGPGVTASRDSRVTSLGRLLRRFKIDELPQLLNVVKGDMHLVGPRPEDPRYVELYGQKEREILAHKPGITSPASLEYRHEEALLTGPDWERVYVTEVMPRKIEIDLAYAAQRTVWTDLGVILKTVAALLA